MMMVRERINEYTKDSGLLGEVQRGFRRTRRAGDNLFMQERLIDMVKVRNDEIHVVFVVMEKA